MLPSSQQQEGRGFAQNILQQQYNMSQNQTSPTNQNIISTANGVNSTSKNTVNTGANFSANEIIQ